jgi:hypothetical protein
MQKWSGADGCTYPHLPPIFQKQVDNNLLKENKITEEQQEKKKADWEKNVHKTIKKEYKVPYQKPTILVEIFEGHGGDDDHFCGPLDWNSIFFKPTMERMRNNPEVYPLFNIDANIFNKDESDYEDANSEETDSQDALDDPEDNPGEDARAQDDEHPGGDHMGRRS